VITELDGRRNPPAVYRFDQTNETERDGSYSPSTDGKIEWWVTARIGCSDGVTGVYERA